MKTTSDTEDVRGWLLSRNIVRVKDARLVRRIVNNCKHQSRLWVLTSVLLAFGMLLVAILLIGAAGLAVMPLAVIGMLALLQADTARGRADEARKRPKRTPSKPLDPNHAPQRPAA